MTELRTKPLHLRLRFIRHPFPVRDRPLDSERHQGQLARPDFDLELLHSSLYE